MQYEIFELDCGDPAPSNGQADLPTGTTYDSSATLTCDPGYTLAGDSVIACLQTDSWNGSATCIKQGMSKIALT